MQTYTQTHTSTYARHIASKVAADLKRLQRLYGGTRPSDQEIGDFETEISLLLDARYLEEITYGFKRNDKWVVALKYRAVGNQLAGAGDDPGGILPTENTTETHFASFLAYSDAWDMLDSAKQEAFEAKLPFQRTSGRESDIEGGGRWVKSRNYASGTLGVQRSMIDRR